MKGYYSVQYTYRLLRKILSYFARGQQKNKSSKKHTEFRNYLFAAVF